MAILLRALPAAVAVALLVSPAAASPRAETHDVAFVTITGHGSVRSLPQGIRCPRTCRALFPRGTHVRFLARAARGWRFTGFSSKWCSRAGGGGLLSRCAFDLVSPHDCIGGACPVGAFGVRAAFVRAKAPG